MEQTTPTPERSPAPSPTVLLLAALAGPALAALTIGVALLMPWWIRMFIDSAAGWCALVLLVGLWGGTRLRPWQVPVSGAVALLSAVVCYYGAAAVLNGGPLALLNVPGWLFPAWLWLLAACVAGPLLTAAGAWIHHDRRPRRMVGLGLLGGVFLAEALYPVLGWAHFRITAPEAHASYVSQLGFPTSVFVQAGLTALLGVALVLVVARRPGDRLRALGAMVPAGLVWYVGVWGAQRVMFLAGMGYLG
ncbi:DUF6518 family protein [Nocardiopsis halotolerans]|uniref:DUF6518 family protein n=1 Tax=Nocardiopsis halotolerans TaxID=124252 RepID=UPI000345A341|nr:DUF6518 family protein [Nocardiopsis halotolerans]